MPKKPHQKPVVQIGRLGAESTIALHGRVAGAMRDRRKRRTATRTARLSKAIQADLA